ncbi:glutathione peroxidase [Youngiibacter multivorans]|uniref:Glutathione peroxidase n=1 Tax=Youngiibacter multivorans TaxID=937251 RepID=A0ABS4G0E1_9CLOT|nr:glutathione peroxidase [Youngiibacter multivorans]MBP1918015.1 glutathione peroxidase [Youngiibacter multivorans]
MNVHDFSAIDIDGVNQDLSQYKGKVMLIVNTASKCGFTPQYEGLEKLYTKHEDKGLVILGFPCNQFKSQEPGDEKDIKNFCEINYGVSFPMFAKVDVNGDDTHELFKYLKSETKGLLGESVKWNFTKFLVDKDGRVIRRYAPTVEPLSIENDILELLG